MDKVGQGGTARVVLPGATKSHLLVCGGAVGHTPKSHADHSPAPRSPARSGKRHCQPARCFRPLPFVCLLPHTGLGPLATGLHRAHSAADVLLPGARRPTPPRTAARDEPSIWICQRAKQPHRAPRRRASPSATVAFLGRRPQGWDPSPPSGPMRVGPLASARSSQSGWSTPPLSLAKATSLRSDPSTVAGFSEFEGSDPSSVAKKR